MRNILLSLLVLLSVVFNAQGQPRTTITLNERNASLGELFKKIENQSDYRFFYLSDIDLSIKRDVNVRSVGIRDAMDAILDGTGYVFRIDAQAVYVSMRTVQEKEKNDSGLISGRVLDSSGQAVPGAVVQNLDNELWATSDAQGNWSMRGKAGDNLKYSCLGYSTIVIKAGDGIMKTVLESETEQLEETVVIGYGTARKSSLTSSVAKVASDKMADVPAGNILSALQGKAAGVNITGISGRPGADVQIRIRGIGTVNNNEPLYIVDGVPVSGISWLNMTDVESIEILKDASAAAIYGTRAANGVVMVTTKKGSLADADGGRDFELSFDAYYGISNPVKDLQPASADEYLRMAEAIYGTDGTTYKLVKAEYDKGYDTNWWKEVNRRNAAMSSYNLGISGGVGRLSYMMSGNYLSHDGIDRKSSLRRISFRLNTSCAVKSWLTVGENLTVLKEDKSGDGDSGENGFVISALRADPLYPVNDPEKNDSNPLNNYGTSTLTNIKNPVAAQDRYLTMRHGNDNIRLVGNVYADFKIYRGLKFRTDFGLELNHGLYDSFTPVYYLEADDQNRTANAWSQIDRTSRMTWVNTLNWSETFGLHRVEALVGFQGEEYAYQFIEGNKYGQPESNQMDFQWLSGGISGDRITGARYEEALLSFFTRVNYSWDDRYMLSASFRRDGSSKFAKGKRWGNFPSVSAGWNLSREKFFRNVAPNWISNIKFRAGWGQLGNERISSGAYATFIEGRLDTRFYFNGEEHVQGYGPVNAGNSDVTWERTETVNLGADFAFLDNRLEFTADWFNKDTDGMLIQVPLPDMFGTFSPWENIGKVNNKGWELSLSWRDWNHKVKWSAGFNVSGYKNKVVSMGGTKPYVDSASGSSRISGYCKTNEGEPIGYFYGYVTDGIFQTPREVDAYVNADGELLQPNAHMGDFRFKDMNGDGKIDDNDKVKLGSPHPDCTIGMNFSISYAGVDLSGNLYASIGNEIFNAFKYYSCQPLGFANVLSGVVDKAWTVGSGENSQPRMTLDDRNDNFRISDFYVEDGSYLRLKDITLGYTFPEKLTSRIKISNLRLYVSARNLFTVTRYSGLDPEVATGTDRANGVDMGVYPQTRVFQFGLNLKF